MIVCIAEKPSVAKDIAKVLGATTAHNGYMEGNGYQVTWTFGHLCCLKEPHDYHSEWKQWTLSRLPMIPERFGIKLLSDKGVAKQFAVIESLMRNAERIVNCGDAGQEGELIQRWVMQKAKATCPVSRLWISSLTEDSIREGFAHLKPQEEYTSLYQAGLCRSIGDWLLGMNATRLYTMRYRQGAGQVLSIGRVQTPTLALIVKRQQEIDSFESTRYWVLSTVYRDTLFTLKSADSETEDAHATTSKSKGSVGRFLSQEEGEVALASISGKPFEITAVQNKNGTESSPRLFDLTSLQVECNKKYAFSAEETLRYIQSLYEKKLTTYPRVDTTYLTDDLYAKCPTILGGLQPYAALVQPLLGKKLPKSRKVFDNSKVTDHHAIIPTGVNPAGKSLSRQEKLVYDLVARRFIAVFYPDCKYTATTVIGRVEKWDFKATGKQIVDQGWRAVYGVMPKQSDDESASEDKELPQFVKGEHGPHEPTLTEKWTQPPKPYTEATLLRAMETAGKTVENEQLRDALKENGIDRPSTRAAIIETLFKRGYIRKERKSLVATPTGMDLIAVIHEELLKSAELTGQWEKKLREIESHKYDAKQFLEELKEMTRQIVAQVMADNSPRSVASAQTQSAKKGNRQRTTTPRTAVKQEAVAAENDGVEKKKRRKAAPKRKQLAKEGDLCPLCGKGYVIRGRTALGCSEWRSGCTFRQPFVEEDGNKAQAQTL